MKKITDNKNIKAGTYVNIWIEFKKLTLIIILNKYSSFKLPNKEKIKNIIELENKHINKEYMLIL